MRRKKKIFGKFYRSGQETTRQTKGTGLGLYLCRKIAADHKATIKVVRQFANRKYFYGGILTIPGALRKFGGSLHHMSSKISILLVEDEENLHEALKLNLELEGYEITSAYDGAGALRAVQSEYFDLIILDVMLPGMDGISVTETIRVQNNDVPILILSAKNASADRVLGLRKGADDYLTKPFNLEELLAPDPEADREE